MEWPLPDLVGVHHSGPSSKRDFGTYTDRGNWRTKEGGEMKVVEEWAPPSGVAAELMPAGVNWDAVSVRREALIFRVEVRDLRRCAVAAVR
ncbi:hypothetical protein GCM10027091_21710 [Streptomyces daliensis]